MTNPRSRVSYCFYEAVRRAVFGFRFASRTQDSNKSAFGRNSPSKGHASSRVLPKPLSFREKAILRLRRSCRIAGLLYGGGDIRGRDGGARTLGSARRALFSSARFSHLGVRDCFNDRCHIDVPRKAKLGRLTQCVAQFRRELAKNLSMIAQIRTLAALQPVGYRLKANSNLRIHSRG